MKLPVHRRDDDHPADREFERLRGPFARELERWPDFLRTLQDGVDDVAPLADVEETDDSFLIDVELPGVRHEDIDLQVHRGRIVVTGERRERERVGLLRHRTRTTGRFSLAVTLPVPVDSDAVTASLDHGMLTVVVPKAAQARRRRIAVEPRR
jgi:HSP20 family protein